MNPGPTISTPSRGLTSNDWMFACGYYLLAIGNGLQHATQSPSRTAALLMAFATAMVIGLWGIRDAARLGQPIPLLSQHWFLLFSWITVPYHVLKTRGW